MPFVDVQFGDFLPDLDGMPNPAVPGYLVDALNVRPVPYGYKPMPTPTDIASVTDPDGSATSSKLSYITASSGTMEIFVTVQISASYKCYQSNDVAQTWSEITDSGGLITTNSQWVEYRQQIIVAANGAILEKSTTDAVSTDLAALSGSPPAASRVGVVRDHVVLGFLSGTDWNAIQWCAIGDPTDWPTPGSADAASKQAGKLYLPSELGYVLAIVGGEKFGLIFQDSGITRMTYVGGSAVYEFDTFERQNGLGHGDVNARPVIVDDIAYWQNKNGIFGTDGYRVRKLSTGSVQNALFNAESGMPSSDGLQGVSGRYFSYFKSHDLIFFAHNGASSRPTLCYNPQTQKFCTYSNADFTWPISFPETALLETSHIYTLPADRLLQRMNAENTSINIQTGFIEIDPGYYVEIEGVYILGTGTPGSLDIAYLAATSYASMSATQSGFTSMSAPDRGLKYRARVSAPFFAFRITGVGNRDQLLRGLRIYYKRLEPIQ